MVSRDLSAHTKMQLSFRVHHLHWTLDVPSVEEKSGGKGLVEYMFEYR